MPEKIQTLLLIFLGLGAVVLRWWKKAQDATRRETQERRLKRPDSPGRPRPVAPGLPATSFEELLKQMQAQNKTQDSSKKALPTPTRREEAPAADPPRSRKKAPKSLERTEVRPVSLEEPATSRSLERAAPVARRAASLPRASTQPELRAATPTPEVSRAVGATSIGARLRNPADLRAAFVLSEILNRKFE